MRRLRDLSTRYALQGELGVGSIGRVFRAKDRALDRPCAIKILRPELLDHPRHRPRFIREAWICARLSHPNIVSVFDFGAIDAGADRPSPCLVMSLLAGRSLRALLRAGEADLSRHISWMVQVCNGVAFAHGLGIIHRDIKPAHIFIGDFGQVVLTDWGLAKVRRAPEEIGDLPPAPSRDVTRVGDIVGTPAYMAPEQAEGRIDSLDHRVDIYALGAILYEVLTGTRPYGASRSIDVLRAVREGPPEPPSRRAPHRGISAELEAACLQAMARDPSERFASALDLAATLTACVERREFEGAATLDRLESEPTQPGAHPGAVSARILTEGRAQAAAFERQLEQAATQRTDTDRRRATLAWDASRAEREIIWRDEARAKQTLERTGWHLSQAVELLEKAMEDPARLAAARADLARVHRRAWRAAETSDDVVSAQYHRARAETFDDGALSAELAGRATLSILAQRRATVDLCTVDDRGAVWSTGAQLRIGTTPMSGRTVIAARMLLRFTAEDGLKARLPVCLQPGESRVIELNLPDANAVPPGFIFICGGRFLRGSDDHAPGAALRDDVDVGSFAIQRDLVSWEAYFEFLEDRLAVGADITTHLPRGRSGPRVIVADRTVSWLNPEQVQPNSPIRSISHPDAVAYADWLGRRLGVTLRLPTEIEWAYAAGAPDGRTYPWGTRFVPGLADARARKAVGPSALDRFPDDESPFGMRSVAGGAREWTATVAEPGRYLLRGGSWRAWPDQCRIGARATAAADLTHRAIGMRLVADLPTVDRNQSGA